MKVRFLLARLLLNSVNKTKIKQNNNQILKSTSIKFTFFFVSYIQPFLTFNIKRLLNISPNWNNKLIIKQSYLILTWLFYLTFINNFQIRLFVFPKKIKNFTLTKSPMAHKNWSKEQFKFKYFLFKIKYKFKLNFKLDWKYFILWTLITKKNFKTFETNLFFIKKFSILYYFFNIKFFNYPSY